MLGPVSFVKCCYQTPFLADPFVDSICSLFQVQTIYGGSNEIMRELIARQIVSKK